MTKSEQRFIEVEQLWFDLDENYFDDMSRTRSDSQARRVETSWYKARTSYMRALADGLEKNSKDADVALVELKTANKEIMKARKDSEKFTAILEKVEKAASSAMSLVLLAI